MVIILLFFQMLVAPFLTYPLKTVLNKNLNQFKVEIHQFDPGEPVSSDDESKTTTSAAVAAAAAATTTRNTVYV